MPPYFDPRMALYDAYGESVANQFKHNQQLHAMYGSTLHDQQYAQWGDKPPRGHGSTVRRQLNGLSVFLALVVPLALFVVTFWAMSFELYYYHPDYALIVVSSALLFSLVLGAFAVNARMHEVKHGLSSGGKHGEGPRTWYYFVFWTSLLACILGICLGFVNMTWNTQRYYDYLGLRKVVNVDPGAMQGQQLIDAGEIDFKMGSKVDVKLHFQWHKGRTYCVAPIISSDGAKLASYDFWAVGMDCCSSRPNDFSCGGVHMEKWPSPNGLRVMEDSEVQGYKLAVEQAVVANHIQSRQPIFLHMVSKPYLGIKRYFDDAKVFAFVSGICYFTMHFILVAIQTYTFGKHSRSGYLDMGSQSVLNMNLLNEAKDKMGLLRLAHDAVRPSTWTTLSGMH